MTVQPLATTTQLEAYRSGDPDLLVAAAQGAVRGYCGWHVAPSVEQTVTLDGPGTKVLGLPTLHLTAVTAVEDVDTTANGETVDLTTLQWSEAGYLLRDCCWTSKLRGVTVTFTHGFDPVPPEVQTVVLDLAETIKAGMGGATRTQVGAVSVQYAAEQMTTMHRLVLDRYRLPPSP